MLIYSNLPTIVTGYVWNFADNSSVFQETWRNVIYLVQAESCIPQNMASFLERQPSTERDVMVLSWRKPCIDWTRNLSNVVYIFDNTTTWSSGRNRLYGIALNRSHEYLYYIFLDEDIEFYFTANASRDIYSRGTKHPLTAFENFLRGYEPAIGLCNYCKLLLPTPHLNWKAANNSAGNHSFRRSRQCVSRKGHQEFASIQT